MALTQTAHAIRLILADQGRFFRCNEDQRIVGCFECHRKSQRIPFPSPQQIAARHPEILTFDTNIQLILMIASYFERESNLSVRPGFKILQEGIAHGRGVKSGRRKFVKQHVALFECFQHIFPSLRDRAFLGQQRACPILEGDLTKFGIIDPVIPIAKIPDASCHHDRQIIGNALYAHDSTQSLDPWIRIFRL